ncbi:MAG: DNA alkylation repair protein [Euryarchaeota archaeon]|nr:DNA alkylation repair protein [Euryarchaeota archaeon]
MDKLQIQKRTKELLEKVDKPEEFTEGLQELLKSYVDRETTNNVFEILDLVMKDKEKDIKQAVSWVLREITKKNPNDVAEFLTRWAQANPGKDARWIIKDGMKKLPKEKHLINFPELERVFPGS